jgi:pyruvate/2-oxoglutarate dehydrogenase complex dihydrolipoamide acyltransferase (E2) component
VSADRFASPAARALAGEFGLDDVAIVGTGREGRVTLADVRRNAPPDPPEGLGEAGARLWRSVRRDYKLRTDEEELLVSACRTLDELGRLEEKLGKVSLTVNGSRGNVRAHPLIGEVRAHRLALQKLLGSIGISEAHAEADAHGEARSSAGRKLALIRHNG